MPHRIRVGDVMTREYTHIHPDTSLYNTAKTMVKKRVGSLLLKSGDNLKGIVTEKDIVWAITKKKCKDLESVKASDIATKKIVTIKPESSLDDALEKMNKKKMRRLPVISNKKVIGYITLKDILKIRPSLFESLSSLEFIKEETDKIQRSESAMSGNFIEAPCEGCGNFDILQKTDNRMICESCRDNM